MDIVAASITYALMGFFLIVVWHLFLKPKNKDQNSQ